VEEIEIEKPDDWEQRILTFTLTRAAKPEEDIKPEVDLTSSDGVSVFKFEHTVGLGSVFVNQSKFLLLRCSGLS
jgi:hypothetical protein